MFLPHVNRHVSALQTGAEEYQGYANEKRRFYFMLAGMLVLCRQEPILFVSGEQERQCSTDVFCLTIREQDRNVRTL